MKLWPTITNQLAFPASSQILLFFDIVNWIMLWLLEPVTNPCTSLSAPLKKGLLGLIDCLLKSPVNGHLHCICYLAPCLACLWIVATGDWFFTDIFSCLFLYLVSTFLHHHWLTANYWLSNAGILKLWSLKAHFLLLQNLQGPPSQKKNKKKNITCQ